MDEGVTRNYVLALCVNMGKLQETDVNYEHVSEQVNSKGWFSDGTLYAVRCSTSGFSYKGTRR